MQCTKCGNTDTYVVDSRHVPHSIWRRRVCKKCKTRFTTFEVTESELVDLVKRHLQEEHRLKVLSRLSKEVDEAFAQERKRKDNILDYLEQEMLKEL